MGNGDIRLRNFAKLVDEDEAGNLSLSFPELVEKLILFENLVIESRRLKEIPILLNTIGFESTMSLLQSGVIQIHNDKVAIGSKNKDLMHLIGFSDLKAFGTDPSHLFRTNIEEIREDCDISDRKFRQLEEQLNSIVTSYPEESLNDLKNDFRSDVTPNSNCLREAICIKIKNELDIEIDAQQIEVNTHLTNDDLFKHESNLKELLGIDKATEYHILDSALLSIGGLNEKILQMDIYNSISGFKPHEISIFKAKLRFVEQIVDTGERKEQLHRVVNVAGLPIIDDDTAKNEINFEQLLDIREEDEIVNFRNWLNKTANISNEELEERLNNFKVKFSKFINTGWGKSTNFLISNGLGAIEPISGAVFSLADTFLLEKFLKQPGAVTFLSTSYPTIFQEK
ncbi:hypothetical protein NC796_26210 [Aliifodinibius sp. S!AR15-10]|uniref:hypothetical protein n=1 Tax=Aliifodinibius sp. S!AR15-10 TaxID=2950437 RepID=UPI0028596D9D|nr:hypothetical protein [Aliifodinibius sp. S!AR15-10]MDR8394661.1 hypothetical protein [Aliifodinibius sp. S!AR15-10]